jgi:hypothetical protein
MRASNWLLIGILAIGLTISERASACSCDRGVALEDRVSEAFRHAKSVVVGKVVRVERRKITWHGEPIAGQRASISVARTFKGSVGEGDRVQLETAIYGTACGSPVKVGDLLILYTTADDVVEFSRCSSGGLLLESLDEIPVLYRLAEEAGTTQ